MKLVAKIARFICLMHGLRRLTSIRSVVLVLAALCGTSLTAMAQTVDLGAAQNVVVLGGSTVTNTGPTIVNGNLALSPGSSVTGFPPGSLVGGTIHINDALANAAHANAFTAYNQLFGETPTRNLTGLNLGTLGGALSPGIFRFDTSAQLTGTLTLDSGGNPNAVFHFLIGSTLTTAPGAAIIWVNGASANIFWQVGSSATIGTGTLFQGNIIALTSITLNTGASLNGRALAINGAVTLDTINVRGPLAFIQGSFAALAAFPPFGVCDTNARVVASALDRVAVLQPVNPLILTLDTLQIGQLQAAFSLLSPEDFAALFTTGFALSRVQVGNIERRLTEVRAGAIGFSSAGFAATDARLTRNYDGKGIRTDGKSTPVVEVAPRQDDRWGFFISGTGEIGDLESTCAARGSSFTTGGVTLGVDYRVTKHFVLGAAVGYADTTADLRGGGSLNVQSGKASLYATAYSGGFFVNALAGAGYGAYRTKRLTLGGFATGETNDKEFNVLLGAGYDHRIGAFTFGPLASIEYARVRFDGFTERDALGALRIEDRSQASLKSAVGLRASYAAKLGSLILTPEVRAQWQHQFLSDTSRIDASFVVGPAFTVSGPRIGRDALVVDLGASAQISTKVALFAFYRGEGGHTNYTSHSINGGVRVSF